MKRKKIFNYLKKKSSTKAIIFIQESHSDKDSEKLWCYQWRGEIYFSHGTKSSRGVLIAFRNGLEYKVLSQVSDTKGRYVIMKIEIQGSLFILVNYYGPNTQPGQVKILKEIDNHLKNLISSDDDDAKIIFEGDFNMYFDCHLDALGGSPKVKQDSCHTVKLIMSEFDLIDLWRVQNPTLRQFTWRRSNPRKMRRLDYLLIPNV